MHRVVLQAGDDYAVNAAAAADLPPLVADIIRGDLRLGIGFGVEDAVFAHVGEGAEIEGLLDPAGLRGAAFAPVRDQLQIVGHDVGAEAPAISVCGLPALEDLACFRRVVGPDCKAVQRDALVRYGAAALAVKAHQGHVLPDRVDGIALLRNKGGGAVVRTLEGLADPGGRRRRVRGVPGPAEEIPAPPVLLNDIQMEQVLIAQVRVVGVRQRPAREDVAVRHREEGRVLLLVRVLQRDARPRLVVQRKDVLQRAVLRLVEDLGGGQGGVDVRLEQILPPHQIHRRPFVAVDRDLCAERFADPDAGIHLDRGVGLDGELRTVVEVPPIQIDDLRHRSLEADLEFHAEIAEENGAYRQLQLQSDAGAQRRRQLVAAVAGIGHGVGVVNDPFFLCGVVML